MFLFLFEQLNISFFIFSLFSLVSIKHFSFFFLFVFIWTIWHCPLSFRSDSIFQEKENKTRNNKEENKKWAYFKARVLSGSRRRQIVGLSVCRARRRQMSGQTAANCRVVGLLGPSTADVWLPLGIVSVWPVDGRRRARQRQTTICRHLAPDERRCRFCRAPYFKAYFWYSLRTLLFLFSI